MEDIIRYLKQLIEKNGPDKADYPEFISWIKEVMERRQSGVISDRDMESLRELWGEALSTDTCQGFALHKPHGYAGDFEIIDRLYTQYHSPKPHLEKWDRFSHEQDAVRAVRHRPDYLLNVITSHLARKKTVSVLNIGSGPGRDMHHVFGAVGNNGKTPVHFDCIEQDERAITYARQVCRDHLAHISFANMNIFRFSPEKQYDIIWASGIFDYFNDRIFTRILSKLLPAVGRDGECVIGNLSSGNRTINYLELMEWHLHYRTADDLKRLAERSGVTDCAVTVGSDATGANLFLHIQRNT